MREVVGGRAKVHTAASTSEVARFWEAAIATFFISLIVGGVYTLIYWINQKAVRSTLKPRCQELTLMLKGTSDEASLT